MRFTLAVAVVVCDDFAVLLLGVLVVFGDLELVAVEGELIVAERLAGAVVHVRLLADELVLVAAQIVVASKVDVDR